MKKIIICKGNANTPARFWNWAVGTEEEYTEDMKNEGWILSECIQYLTKEQLKYLNEK